MPGRLRSSQTWKSTRDIYPIDTADQGVPSRGEDKMLVIQRARGVEKNEHGGEIR